MILHIPCIWFSGILRGTIVLYLVLMLIQNSHYWEYKTNSLDGDDGSTVSSY